MYPYQNQPSSSPGHQGPSSSQHFLENVESAASRFKRAFGKKRPSRAGDDDQGTQSDAPNARKMGPVSRISTFIPRKDPKPALQLAASSFQALGQRLNKPLPPRIPSQIGPPPDMDLPEPPRDPEPIRKSVEPRKSHSSARIDPVPVPVPVPVKSRPVYRTSQLVEGPEISAAIEYMLDGSIKNSASPPVARMSDQAREQRLLPPSPKVLRSGSFGNENTAPQTSNATKRRSMSLSMMPVFQAPNNTSLQPACSQAPPSSFSLSPSLSQASSTPHHRSHSTLPTFTSPSTSSEPSAAKTDAYASGIISHTNPDKSSNNFKGKLAALSSPPTPTSPAPSRSTRNISPAHSKTASMVASIGPAATAATGMAMSLSKRAYEKVNSMWGPSSASAANNSSGGVHSSGQGYESSGPAVSRVKSRLNGNGHGHGNYGGSFSDVETSRRRMTPSGGMDRPIGPNLGTLLRPPFRRTLQGGGLVFGRPLVDCVRDTKPLVVVGDAAGAGIEARFIPALVLRCVQHIERWGITEEGIFRISGSASHIKKLRTEFASGADYDLQICGPGDLDPHAVASVLKAFLRELPEPILTRAKAPLYDAAFEKAKEASFMLATSSAPPTLGYNSSPQQVGLPSGPRMGLPSGPRDTSTLPSRGRNMNPNMQSDRQDSGQPDDSTATPHQALEELVSEFQVLTASLPMENRDLLMTITELLQKAAGQSRTTKMPLSNLLLVLCPSMNMNPGVLKIFVEHHQAIFAEPSPVPNEKILPSPVEPTMTSGAAAPDYEAHLESTQPDHTSDNRNQAEHNPPESTSSSDLGHTSEDLIPNSALPVRKQSLRRLAQGSPGLRTTPTSSPSAYRETFVTDPPPGYSDISGRNELAQTATHDNYVVGHSKSASTPTSPLHQSFSASDLSRPAHPIGPRGPRTVPAPLALQRERSNTPERSQTLTRPHHLRSASSSSTVGRDVQANPTVPVPNRVEEPVHTPAPPDLQIESRSILAPQTIGSAPPSSQGNTIEPPSLPDVQLQPPMTSSFLDRRSVTPMAKVDQAHPSPALSDVPPSAFTPKTAESSTSSQGNTLTFPSLPEVHPLPPMTSSFADGSSAVPMAGADQPQPSPASLIVPSPDSARSAVQPLTPLLAAMEKENASSPSGLPATPDPGTGELNKTHPTVEPLTIVKKHTSNPTSQVDRHASYDSDSAPYSASSATTDTSDNTNIFDRQLSWPAVPTTIPVVRPSQNGTLNQQLTSIAADPPSPREPLMQVSGQDSTAQYVMVDDRDDSALTAKTLQSKFPAEARDDDLSVSPVVANGQYPPDPYPSVPSAPQVSNTPQPEKSGPTSYSDVSERTIVTITRKHSRRSSSGELRNAVSTMDTTTRSMRARAPRLTVNSKDMLAGNSYWANELQRALRSSSPTSPPEARHSAELSTSHETLSTKQWQESDRTFKLRICLIILGIFIFTNYAISQSSKRSSLRDLLTSQSALSPAGPKPTPNTRPLRVHWGNEPVPETVVLLHKIPGWTVFKNLYIFSDTIYIVTSRPETLPPTRLMISNGLDLVLREENEPTDKTMSIISPEEAKNLFGTSAGLLDGLSFMQTDSPQFINHMYHFLVEIFALGHWRTYTSPELDRDFGPSRTFPRRFIIPRATQKQWQDRAGMNQWVMRAGLGSMSFEFKDDWSHLMSLERPFILENVVLGDRAAWHRAPSLKAPTQIYPMAVKDLYWEPIRQSVVAFALPPTRTAKSKADGSTHVITYISRQKTGRRLKDEDHESLVMALYRLGRDHGYEINIPLMEDMDKATQVTLLSRTTILLGVHGNGLSGQLWLKPSPRATVIELFFENGFAYDYEYTARSLGLKHYGFWNGHYFTAPDLPPQNYPKGFHDSKITCNASAIAAFIHRRLTLNDPSEA